MRLALEAGVFVRADRLIDDLWGGAATQRNTLQSKVARVRRALGDAAVIEGGEGGYRLAIDPEDVDALRVLRDSATATRRLDAGDDRAAAELSAAALARFRGELLPAAGDWAAPQRARLEELRIQLVETKLAAQLRLGEASIGELEAAVAAHPYQEGLWELLITALYRAGRQADALASYQRVRSRLADELGLEPGPRLAELERQILHHAPALQAPLGNLPSLSAELVGRDDEIAAVSELLRGAAARRGRRARRHRQDGARRRDRSRAGGERLARPARGGADDGRRPRRRDRRPRCDRRGRAARAAQSRRGGGDPRQLRARHRRGRRAGRAPARRGARAAAALHQPGRARHRRRSRVRARAARPARGRRAVQSSCDARR